MLVANATDGYREHHDQGQSTAHLHFLQSSNGMEFKAKRHIGPTIDPFDGGAMFMIARIAKEIGPNTATGHAGKNILLRQNQTRSLTMNRAKCVNLSA